MGHEGGDHGENDERPSHPARLPADGERESAADLDQDGEYYHHFGHRHAELGEVAGVEAECQYLANAEDDEQRGHQQAADQRYGGVGGWGYGGSGGGGGGRAHRGLFLFFGLRSELCLF